MRIPPYIKRNDTAAFIAPSFGCTIEPYYSSFKNALRFFENRGYRTILGPNCFSDCGTGISNTPEACADEFMKYYTNDASNVLLSCGGGELMCEILPFIDWDRIKDAPPKWFMGYSDNTNIGFLLATICDTVSVYGPNASAFGMEPLHRAPEEALALMEGKKKLFRGYDLYEKESLKTPENPLAPYHLTEPSVKRAFPASEAAMSGMLLGGCLDCLANLVGTKYDQVGAFLNRHSDTGIIWFLEACDLNVFSVRRALWQLREAGWFNTAAGFIIGRLLNPAEMFGLDRFRAVTDVLSPLNVPIIMDADVGHVPPMLPFANGLCADIVLSGNDFTLSYH